MAKHEKVVKVTKAELERFLWESAFLEIADHDNRLEERPSERSELLTKEEELEEMEYLGITLDNN